MENMMKRYFEEKEVIWENDFSNNGIYAGTTGVFKSEDGKYFFANYHANELSYTGKNYLEIIPEDIALESAKLNYYDCGVNQAEMFLVEHGYAQ